MPRSGLQCGTGEDDGGNGNGSGGNTAAAACASSISSAGTSAPPIRGGTSAGLYGPDARQSAATSADGMAATIATPHGAPCAPDIGGDEQMPISQMNQCDAQAGHGPAGLDCGAPNGAAAGQATTAKTMTANDAWESLGTRMRRYIIMQHGRIDMSSARDASKMPWTAVRGAIEAANDEFDGDAAEAAILDVASTGRHGGGQR